MHEFPREKWDKVRLMAVRRGVVSALLAAATFGATTPVIAVAGRDVGTFTTAALLYAGAAGGALLQLAILGRTGAGLRRGQWRRVALVAFFGAALAPTLLAWGLRRTGGTTGSLLLNLEVVFTVLLGRLVYGERIGHRVSAAVALIVAGGGLLAVDAAGAAAWSAIGAAAVVLATLAWAVDNALTRPLAEADPVLVVAAKGTLGAALTAGAALVAGERLAGAGAVAALLVCGATGYGFSLRFYLIAQREIGVARTGSAFALAPFVGAGLGWLLGFRAVGGLTFAAMALFALALRFLATERHHHAHRHEAIDHTHPHRHDDGHHGHAHDPPVLGEHTHPHHHDALEHDHDHMPDLHHDHGHGDGRS
jgi:drug/metabolite transporter (DMT)-like permease